MPWYVPHPLVNIIFSHNALYRKDTQWRYVCNDIYIIYIYIYIFFFFLTQHQNSLLFRVLKVIHNQLSFPSEMGLCWYRYFTTHWASCRSCHRFSSLFLQHLSSIYSSTTWQWGHYDITSWLMLYYLQAWHQSWHVLCFIMRSDWKRLFHYWYFDWSIITDLG